jgi:hypothetical protein
MALTIEQKKKIHDFIGNFSETVKRESWISSYDTDIDSMSFRLPVLSKDAEKRYLGDEFAFYLTAKNEVQGIFIEYFLANFVAHHKDMKDLKEEIGREVKGRKQNESRVVIQLEAKETRKMIPELQNALIKTLLPTR